MKRLAKSESDSFSTLLRRRDFLTLGSAGLLAPLFGNLAWAEPLAAGTERSVQTGPMSVGYIDGSEEYRSFKRLPRKVRRPLLQKEADEEEGSPVIIPAESLFQADTSLPGRPLRRAAPRGQPERRGRPRPAACDACRTIPRHAPQRELQAGPVARSGRGCRAAAPASGPNTA